MNNRIKGVGVERQELLNPEPGSVVVIRLSEGAPPAAMQQIHAQFAKISQACGWHARGIRFIVTNGTLEFGLVSSDDLAKTLSWALNCLDALRLCPNCWYDLCDDCQQRIAVSHLHRLTRKYANALLSFDQEAIAKAKKDMQEEAARIRAASEKNERLN